MEHSASHATSKAVAAVVDTGRDLHDMKVVSKSRNRYLLGIANGDTKCLFGEPLPTKEALGIEREIDGPATNIRVRIRGRVYGRRYAALDAVAHGLVGVRSCYPSESAGCGGTLERVAVGNAIETMRGVGDTMRCVRPRRDVDLPSDARFGNLWVDDDVQGLFKREAGTHVDIIELDRLPLGKDVAGGGGSKASGSRGITDFGE